MAGVATLEEVLDHYAAGGRTIAAGTYAGRGHDNPKPATRAMTGIALTPRTVGPAGVLAQVLTDAEVTCDPAISNPL